MEDAARQKAQERMAQLRSSRAQKLPDAKPAENVNASIRKIKDDYPEDDYLEDGYPEDDQASEPSAFRKSGDSFADTLYTK
jgi:hypothetical protein